MAETQRRGGRQPRGSGNPLTEWGAASIGIVLLAGSVLFSVQRGLRHGDSPPDIVVTPTAVTEVSQGYLVRFTAENRGAMAAAGVRVEGEVRRADGTNETADVTLDYLPAGSTRTGGLIVRSDPRAGNLVLRAVGYHKP